MNMAVPRPGLWSTLVALILTFFLTTPVHVSASASDEPPPENASLRLYGTGWQCNRGFKESDGACKALEVPVHAYVTDTTYGQGWSCRRGYQQKDQACVAIALPANAYLRANRGDSWKCERGYRNGNGGCVFIKLPANGYLIEATYSKGWECERGYLATKMLVLPLMCRRTDISRTAKRVPAGRASGDFASTVTSASRSRCLRMAI